MDNDYSDDRKLSEGMIVETSNNGTPAGISKPLAKFRQLVVGLVEIYSVFRSSKILLT